MSRIGNRMISMGVVIGKGGINLVMTFIMWGKKGFRNSDRLWR